MNILHLTFSPRGAESESTRLSRLVLAALQARHPDAAVHERHYGNLAHVDAGYAVELGTPQPPGAALPSDSLRTSDRLVDELRTADRVVIGTPMHNFTVPSALKAWIDHVVRVRSTFRITPQGKVGVLPDRPVYVAVSSGGVYAGEDARQPDFLTPYLKVALRTIGLADVTFFSVQGTAGGAQAVGLARARAEADIAAHFAGLNARSRDTAPPARAGGQAC